VLKQQLLNLCSHSKSSCSLSAAAAVSAQADFEAVDAVAQTKLAVVAAAAAEHAALVSSMQVHCIDTYLQMCVCQTHTYTCVQTHARTHQYPSHTNKFYICRAMGWLRLVGSLKLQVSFAKEPYKRDVILQKRPKILKRLLIVATPYAHMRITQTRTSAYAHTLIHRQTCACMHTCTTATTRAHSYANTHREIW